MLASGEDTRGETNKCREMCPLVDQLLGRELLAAEPWTRVVRGRWGGVGSAFSAFELGLTAFARQDLQRLGGSDRNSCLGERRLLGAGAVELEGALQRDIELLLEPDDRPLDLLIHPAADGHELTFPMVGSMARAAFGVGLALAARTVPSGGGPTRFVRPCAPGGLKRLAEICRWGRRR